MPGGHKEFAWPSDILYQSEGEIIYGGILFTIRLCVGVGGYSNKTPDPKIFELRVSKQKFPVLSHDS